MQIIEILQNEIEKYCHNQTPPPIQEHIVASAHLAKKIFSEQFTPNNCTETTLKQFIHDISFHNIQYACAHGFPFAFIDCEFIESVISRVIKDGKSLLYRIFSHVDVIEESILNEKYTSLITSLSTELIAKTCRDLYSAYRFNSDLRAGYYYLWLFKTATKIDFKIPAQIEVDTIENLLIEICDQATSEELYIKISEILSFTPFSYYKPNLKEAVFDFLSATLREISVNDWPSKMELFMRFLFLIPLEKQRVLLIDLFNGECPETTEASELILQILQASSPKEKTKLAYLLETIHPYFSSCLSALCNAPYQLFENQLVFSSTEGLPSIKSIHNVDPSKQIFLYKHTLLFVKTPDPQFDPLPYIVAYDTLTEKILYWFSMPDLPAIELSLSGNRLIIRSSSHFYVDVLNVETGEIENSSFREICRAAPKGFYLNDENTLFTQSKNAVSVFKKEQKIAECFFNSPQKLQSDLFQLLPLNEYCGISRKITFSNKKVREEFHVFSNKGRILTIPNCLDAMIIDNYLYSIESTGIENTTALSVRDFNHDAPRLDTAKRVICIKASHLSFAKMPLNASSIILVSEDPIRKEKRLVFVNSVTGVSIMDARTFTHFSFDLMTDKIWLWHSKSHNLYQTDRQKSFIFPVSLASDNLSQLQAANGSLFVLSPK